MSNVLVAGEWVRVRIVEASPPVIVGGNVQNRLVMESVDSSLLTFIATDIEPGDEMDPEWEFLVAGEPVLAVGEVARFEGLTTGARITVRLTRSAANGDFGSFVLRVSDSDGAIVLVTVNIVPGCVLVAVKI